MDKATPDKPQEYEGSYSAGWFDAKLSFAGISAAVLFIMFFVAGILGITKIVSMIFLSLFVLLIVFIYIYGGWIKNFNRRNLAGILVPVFLGGFALGIAAGVLLLILRDEFGLSEELEMILVLITGAVVIVASYLKLLKKKKNGTS
jgi:asparagine N-glycosylation enzyme membrane subunit Stt3